MIQNNNTEGTLCVNYLLQISFQVFFYLNKILQPINHSFLDIHHSRQEDLRQDFETKQTKVIKNNEKQMKDITERSNIELTYLKTVIFALDKNFEDFQKKYKNNKDTLIEDYTTSVSDLE